MFGHVNHTRYLEYMEWARFSWADHHGFPLPAMVRDEQRGPAILRAKLHFRRECRMGDDLIVTAEAAGATRGIGRIHQEIRDATTGDVVCSAEMTFVVIDLVKRKAVELPAKFLALCPAN
jgi:acyl-CoA thioester hydrolase/thioesterase-3